MISGGIRLETREAFFRVWETFTGIRDGKSARLGRLVGWALLVLGIALAADSAFQMGDLRESGNFTPSLSQTESESETKTDKARLQALSNELRLALWQRARSAFRVQSVKERERNPLAAPPEPDAHTVPVPSSPDISFNPPPEIVVKAVMKSVKSWAVVVDIAGDGNGLILRPGDSFMKGRGRVVRMDGDRLIIQWDGREWTAAPGAFSIR